MSDDSKKFRKNNIYIFSDRNESNSLITADKTITFLNAIVDS